HGVVLRNCQWSSSCRLGKRLALQSFSVPATESQRPRLSQPRQTPKKRGLAFPHELVAIARPPVHVGRRASKAENCVRLVFWGSKGGKYGVFVTAGLVTGFE